MEGLTKRAYLLAALFLAGGAAAHLSLPSSGPVRTEKWMEQESLKSFGRYRMKEADPSDPEVSYRMDKNTYDTLAPYGIVARDLSNGDVSFDVVLIASEAKSTFHDPRVCFTAQGWQLDQDVAATVSTKTRGVVPVSLARIHSDNGDRWAAFCYRGPDGFTLGATSLKMQMFKYSLLHARAVDGVFYRFIGEDAQTSKEELLKFIGNYLDASAKHGTGYF